MLSKNIIIISGIRLVKYEDKMGMTDLENADL